MDIFGRAVLVAVLCVWTALAQDSQIPITAPGLSSEAPRRVAIIGAGSAGSSTAYYLHKFASNASIPHDITIYERNPYIGGRSTTVHPYDDPSGPALELGASIFVQVNHNLVSAAAALNLSTSSYKPAGALSRSSSVASAPALGIFDGQRLVYLQQNEDTSYWDLAKLLWRYGMAPIKTRNLMKRTVGKFLKLYEKPLFPFASLTEAVQEVGLDGVVAVTGESYLKRWEIWGDFSWDVVQAATRVNYAANLDGIHGVEAMVCMAAEGAMSVQGGNWRIFEGMIRASGAQTMLGTEVRSVEEADDGKLIITATPVGGGKSSKAEFDDIVLAAPHQYTNIDWQGVLRGTPDVIPYVNLHVTLFTSRRRLNPEVFGLDKGASAPRTVLTTIPRESESGLAAPPRFFSISLLKEVINPVTKKTEFAYKIFTPEPVNSTFLGQILQLGELPPTADLSKDEVSWIYRKLWQSYPVELPRVTFEDIMLADRVWYTGGIESFISTMETSSLMGKNVAKLMTEEWEMVREFGDMIDGSDVLD